MMRLAPYERHALAVLLLFLLGVGLYLGVLPASFILDDHAHITRNPALRLDGLASGALWRAAFEGHSPATPIANLSFALNYLADGYDPLGYRLVNVLVHITNGALLYALAYVLLGLAQDRPPVGSRRIAALLAAALFVAHPLATASVSYVVNRTTVLATLFCLGALACYVAARLGGGGARRSALLGAALLSWMLALGCKPVALGLPLLVALFELAFGRRLVPRSGLRHGVLALLVGALLVSAVHALAADAWTSTSSHLYPPQWRTAGERLMLEPRIAVFFLASYLLPNPLALNLEHQFQVPTSLLNPLSTLACLVVIAAMTLTAAALMRRARLLSFGILWFVIVLFAEAALLGEEAGFEHRSYLPGAGLTLAAAAFLGLVVARWRLIAIAGGVCAVAYLGAGSLVRNDVWRDRLSLWTDIVQKSPASALARNHLGQALAAAGRTEDAITEFMQAARLDPEYADPHTGLGVLHANEGRYRTAIQHFMLALRVDPDDAEAHHNLGVTLVNQRRFNAAIESFRAALRIAPDYASAHENLAFVYGVLGEKRRRCAHLRAALRADPGRSELRSEVEACAGQPGEEDGR